MPGAQLLVINPKKKRRRKKNARRRSHSRRRHRNTRRRVVRGHRIHRRRKRNPFARRKSHSHKRRRRNPMSRRRRHRNPLSMGGIKGALVPAAIGAVGALGVQVAYNYARPYLPSALTSNQYVESATRIGIAIGVGMLAKRFVGAGKAQAAVLGAITVELASVASFALAGKVPGLSGFGAYLGQGMGAYSSPNPAPYLQGLRGMGAYIAPRMAMSGFGGLGLGMGGLGAMPGAMPGSLSTDNG